MVHPRLLAHGAGFAMLLGMERDGLLRIVPDEPTEQRDEPRKVVAAVDPAYDAPELRHPGPLPWGSTKYQKARMRQAERLRAKQR